MLSPFLLIGVGGSGGKTLRIVHHQLSQRLAVAKWTGPMPAAWRFLHIDVPVEDDTNVPGVLGNLGAGSYVPLAMNGTDYLPYDEILIGGPSGRRAPATANWRPNPTEAIQVSITSGAGQYRAIGRVALVCRMSDVTTAIANAIAAMSAPGADTELAAASLALGADRDGAPQPRVILISSLAGGSGSGAFLDIAELLSRRPESWVHESIAMLYTPDVFKSIDGTTAGTQPNALGALAETLNAHYRTRPFSEEHESLFQGAGGQLPSPLPVPRYKFLIGRGHADPEVNLRSDLEVYRATAGAISSLMADQVVQRSFNGSVLGNFKASAGIQDSLSLVSGFEQPFSAIGFGSVGLGRRLFRDYSSERLAKRAVNVMLSRHLVDPAGPAADAPDDLIEDHAAAIVGSFLAACQLREVGTAQNEILDALRDGTYEMEEKRADDLVEKLLGELEAVRRTGIQWIQTVEGRFTVEGDVGDDFRRTTRKAVLDRAPGWMRATETAVRAQLGKVVGEYGLRVASRLLGMLTAEFEAIIIDLEEEIKKSSDTGNKALAAISGSLKGERKEIGGGHSAVRAAVEYGSRAILMGNEADLRRKAVSFVVSLKEDLLPALASAVDEAERSLRRERQERKITVGPKSYLLFDLWPEQAVPAHHQPLQSEVLLEPASSFPKLLEDTIVETFSAGGTVPTTSEALDDAVQEIIAGMWLGADPQTPGTDLVVEVEQHWSASIEDRVTRQSGRFSIDATLEGVFTRAQSWISNRTGQIHNVAFETLTDYLQPSDRATAAQRVETFGLKLAEAYGLAKPFLKIDSNLHATVHGPPSEPTMTLSPMPFEDGTPAYLAAVEVLRLHGVQDAQLSDYFGASDRQSIDIASFAAPRNPLVFESLLDPIVDKWTAVKGESRRVGTSHEFWKWRRARPLDEFIPLSQDALLAAARGWFAGWVMGAVRRENHPDGARYCVHLTDYEGRAWAGSTGTLPVPFLSPVPARSSHQEIFALAMESLPLAFLEVARGTNGALEPYATLIALGSDGGLDQSSYDCLSPLVAEWLDHGGANVPFAPSPLYVATGASAEQMQTDIATKLSEDQEAIAEKFMRTRLTAAEALSTERRWELRNVLYTAAGQVAAAFSAHALGDGGDDEIGR